MDKVTANKPVGLGKGSGVQKKTSKKAKVGGLMGCPARVILLLNTRYRGCFAVLCANVGSA